MAKLRPPHMRRCSLLILTAGLGLGLGGCLNSERDDRPLVGKPGVYIGPADEKLTQEQRRALQLRTGLQN